jgi:hypothetical protein
MMPMGRPVPGTNCTISCAKIRIVQTVRAFSRFAHEILRVGGSGGGRVCGA